MKTHDEQNAYLFGLMRQVDVKRKRVKSSSRRTCTFEYYVRVKGRETQVCQTAFKNIHAITERKVRVLCKKMDDGIMFPNDNRGKNSHRRSGEVRLPQGVVDQIKNHIYSIVHTHRLKDFIRLDKIAGLEINISKMWKDYIKTYDPENINATMPKSKRNSDGKEFHTETPIAPAPVLQETYNTVSYPGSGHLVNMAENFFAQNQFPPAVLPGSAAPANYYQQQPLVLQASTPQRPGQTHAYIVLQAKPESPNTLTMNFSQANMLDAKAEKVKVKKEKKRGPLVKQWRYTNIFHEEINGAALAAIKTRLGMYYAESDAARKKAKRQEAAPPTSTVTLYAST